MSLNKQNAAIVLLFSIVLFFYFWTATEGRFYFNDYTQHSFYNHLTDAFIEGQLHLQIKAPAEFYKLPNPYNPKATKKYRTENNLHDLSFYNGKFYLCFGPTAALVLYFPSRLLFNFKMHDALAVLIFMFGVLVWSTLILFFLKNKYFKKLPMRILLISVAVLGFSNIGIYLLRRASVYEVAISCGCFFFTGAIYWFCRTLDNPASKLWIPATGSLFLGLAVASRPNLSIATFFLVLMLIITSKDLQEAKQKKDLALALVLPLASCMFILFIYNYMRFGNIFETGYTYQLRERSSEPMTFFSFLPNLLHYLFEPPYIDSKFPYIHSFLWKPPSPIFQTYEKITGVIPSVPFILMTLIGPYIYLNHSTSIKNKNPLPIVFPHKEFLLVFLTGLINLFILCLYPFVTLRYGTDFYTLLILSTCFVFFYFDQILRSNLLPRNALRITSLTLAVISIFLGIIFSIEGCTGGLRIQNPELYNRLDTIFKPISKFIGEEK